MKNKKEQEQKGNTKFSMMIDLNQNMLCYAMLSHFSHVRLCVTP